MSKKQTKVIELPCYGITLSLDNKDIDGDSYLGGTIISDLHNDRLGNVENEVFDSAMDAIESMILAHACAGVDVLTPAYLEGIETAVESISQQFN